MGTAAFLPPTLTITDDRHPPSPSPSFLLWIANLLLSIVKLGSFPAVHSEKHSLLGESGSGSGGFLAAEWERRLSSRRLLRTRATRTSSNSGRTGLPSKPKQHGQQCLRAILLVYESRRNGTNHALGTLVQSFRSGISLTTVCPISETDLGSTAASVSMLLRCCRYGSK